MLNVLLVINATVDAQTATTVSAGRSPRKDYLELQRALNADVIDLGAIETRKWARWIRRFLGASVAQGLLAGARCTPYDAIFVDRETTGFILAALLKPRRHRPRLVMLGHLLSPAKKRLLFRSLGLHTAIDCIVVHSSLQKALARDQFRLRSQQIAMIPYHSDDRFWTPVEVEVRNQICSAGLEYRDHSTLIEAVRDLDVDVIIAAASHWSNHEAIDPSRIPPRVRVSSFDYLSLRQLYAHSLFVVIPLMDVDNQAGITTILEAMAMGKAVVVSHSRGQIDVIRDRRRRNRVDPGRVTQPAWIRQLGADDGVAEGQTGIYVMPGDKVELHRTIAFLLQHPEEARMMGANGRRVVEATMSLDHYIQRLAEIITGEHAGDRVSSISNQPARPIGSSV